MQALQQITWPTLAIGAVVLLLALLGAWGIATKVGPLLRRAVDRIIIFACGCYVTYIGFTAPEIVLFGIGLLLVMMSLFPLLTMWRSRGPKDSAGHIPAGNKSTAAPAAPKPPGS